MKPIELGALEEVAQLATGPRAVFLSASIARAGDLKGGRAYAAEINSRRVVSLVSWIARYLLEADVRIVFGGHPAISPVLLRVVNELGEGRGPPAVFVFQSKVFEPMIPEDTWRLADWSRGQLVWTAARPAAGDRSAFVTSLSFMRRCMVRAPGMCGAVFLGGMDGLDEEVAAFDEAVPDGPTYAVPTSGGAARAIHEIAPARRRGGLDPAAIAGAHPAAQVAAAIVGDLVARFVDPGRAR